MQSAATDQQPARLPLPLDREDLDRRSFARLGFLSVLAYGASGSFSAALASPACITARAAANSGTLPAHLTSLDPADPNSFVPHGWAIAGSYAQGDVQNLIHQMSEFITANLSLLKTSAIPRRFAELYRAQQLPTTIDGVIQTFFEAQRLSTSPRGVAVKSSLCIEGPPENPCIETGCLDLDGSCWSVPEILQDGAGTEPCECIAEPPWYEIALLAIFLLILFATPGPDEIPGIIAVLSRLIIRAAPAIA